MKEARSFLNQILKSGLLLILSCVLIIDFESSALWAQSTGKPLFGKSEKSRLKQRQAVQPVLYRNNPPLIKQYEVFTNGSFESGDFSGWITEDISDPFISLQVAGAGLDPGYGLFTSEPTDGYYNMVNGWEGAGPGTIRIAQDVLLPPGALTLEFDYRAGWDLYIYGATQSRSFLVNIEPVGGGDPLQTETILTAEPGTRVPDSGPLHGSVDISAFADSSVRISFDWFVQGNWTGPSFFQLDNVFIIPVDTSSQIMVSRTDINFGSLPVSYNSAPIPVTIRSVGTENLTLTSITDPESPFSLINLPSLPVVIPPGGAETFEVVFSPSNADIFNATITISSNDLENPEFELTLSGEGVEINPAESGVLYGSTGNYDGGNLIAIDPGSGEGTLIGSTGMGAVPGLAINSNGDIYGIDANNSDLYLIDAASGRAVFIARTGLYMLPAIAFDVNDILYGLGQDPVTEEMNLYTINTSTGVPTEIGPAGPWIAWRGMSFNPMDGILYASTSGQEIYIIDPNNGTPVSLGYAGISGGLPDIQFDNGGTLYGAAGGGGQTSDLVTIDVSTLEATVVGSIGFSSVSGLAYRPVRPEGTHAGIFPREANYGVIAVGLNSSARSITIRSVGTENLTVTGITDPGSPFILSNIPSLPAIIPPGGMETFEITFSPTSEGIFTDTLAISSDDVWEPEVNIFLSGEAVEIDTATSGVLYGSTGYDDGGNLISIDLSTGEGTYIGSTGLSAVPALAINSQGYIYGVDADNRYLYLLDAVDGTSLFVGPTGLDFIPAIAFDGNDILYGLGTDPVRMGSYLYTINTTTGVPLAICPVNSEISWRGMSFNYLDGTLWASTSYQELYVIDPATGTSTYMGSTELYVGMPDIQFDSQGNLYGAAGGGSDISDLVIIDQNTALGTVIGSIGFSSVSGLAYRLERPEGSHIGIFPSSIEFNRVGVDFSSTPRKITIRSAGTENLTVSAISEPGSPFLLSNVPSLPVVIPPGGTATFEVTFAPTSADTFGATIVVNSNDAVDPNTDISLSGIGVMINPAVPGVLYGSTGDIDGGRLITINLNSGVGTLIGSTGLNAVPGLAINSHGDIYGINGDNSDLYLIDAASGNSVFIAHTGLTLLPAIAFDSRDVLYGLGMDPLTFNWYLYTINTITGKATPIGPCSNEAGWRGMSFNPIDSTLWGSTGGQDIYTIDLLNGTPTYIGITEFYSEVPDIQFDNEGNLYGTIDADQNSRLISISKSTAVATVIGPIGFASVSGLAFRFEPPKVPHIDISPLSVDFNEVTVGSGGVIRAITISSVGNDTLTVSTISDPGLPFTLSKIPALPLLIPPGGIDTIEVTFSPSSADSSAATFSINSNDPDNPSQIVSLSGVGIVSKQDDAISGIPVRFCLHQNYPNPFNPLTTIRYEIPVTGPVKINIYDMLGREVLKLVDGVKAPGIYTITWNAADLPSGVYLYRLQAKSFTTTKKVVLIK